MQRAVATVAIRQQLFRYIFRIVVLMILNARIEGV